MVQEVNWCRRVSLLMPHNVVVHPAEGRREVPLPRIGCNDLLEVLLVEFRQGENPFNVFRQFFTFSSSPDLDQVIRA